MLKELLSGAWEARTLVPRLVLEVDDILGRIDNLSKWATEVTEVLRQIREQLAKLEAAAAADAAAADAAAKGKKSNA